MRRYASYATILFALSLAGCASGASGRSIAQLEEAQRAEPGSFAVNRSLGIGYYKAGRYAEARAALQTAAQSDSTDGTTALYLGLAAEEMGDLAAAKRAYSTYLTVGRTSRVRVQLQSHLAALSRRELTVVTFVRAAVVAAGGGVLAIVVAVAASPLTPIGLARRAEISPGVSIDVAALGLGFVAVVLLTAGWGLVASVRAGRRARVAARAAPPRPSHLAALAAGLGPSAAAGLSMSVGPRRTRAFGAALLAALVAVTGVVAAVTFGASLRHLIDTPREQGWNWDVFVGNPNAAQAFTGDVRAPSFQSEMTGLLAADRDVGAFSAVALSDGTIDGHPTGIAGVEPIRGSIYQRVVRA